MWEGRSLGRVVLRAVIFIRVFLSVVGLDGMGGGTRIGGGKGLIRESNRPGRDFLRRCGLGAAVPSVARGLVPRANWVVWDVVV